MKIQSLSIIAALVLLPISSFAESTPFSCNLNEECNLPKLSQIVIQIANDQGNSYQCIFHAKNKDEIISGWIRGDNQYTIKGNQIAYQADSAGKTVFIEGSFNKVINTKGTINIMNLTKNDGVVECRKQT